jgi:hypothetical protein
VEKEAAGMAVAITGAFSLIGILLSGFIAYYAARRKIREEIEAQRNARALDKIAELRERYLTPLRHYASLLSSRISELETKYKSDREAEIRRWFKTVKDQVTRDQRRDDFITWCYYEGLFAVTTLYYTCSYFQCAQQIRQARPFLATRPRYQEKLETLLSRATDAFVWEGGAAGIWAPSQELIGELFQHEGAKLTYAQLCGELVTDDPSRRAPFFRPLDFYWSDLRAGEVTAALRSALDQLRAFLDTTDPRSAEGLDGPVR